MTYGIEQVDEILRGYEAWRDSKRAELEIVGIDHFSVTEYLTEYRKTEALRMVADLRAVYADEELTWQEVDAQVREILGIINVE